MFTYLSIFCLLSSISSEYVNYDYDYGNDEIRNLPRNLIFMVPDGTSPNVFTMARTVLDPSHEKRLHIDDLLLGTVRTHSTTSYVTDSASSATAYSTGFKTYDTAIAVDTEGQPLGTILEAAKAKGMVVGMIATSRVTHATPACFAAHVDVRSKEDEIAAQYCQNKNLDFLLGGGRRHFTDEQLTDMQAHGYTLIQNAEELNNYDQTNNGTLNILGLFAESHMAYEVDRCRTEQPSLTDMVTVMLKALGRNAQAQKHGFFILIEGSRIDHAGHSNDSGGIAKEAIEFDRAVAVVKEFVRTHPNTGFVSAADHGTGGMTLGMNGTYEWNPEVLQATKMTGEGMGAVLEDVIQKRRGVRGSCSKSIKSYAMELLEKYNAITELTETQLQQLDIAVATSISDNSADAIVIQLLAIVSEHARIGWTTGGHVGGDVNLYCYGPMLLERRCRGAHQNTYLNSIMSDFLQVNLQKETIRLRTTHSEEL